MNSRISDKDKKDWQDFLLKDEKLPNKDFLKQKKVQKIMTIDLHGKTLDQANQIIENFIKNAYEEKVYKLKVITGKGLHSNNKKNPYISNDLGILKYSVPEFIKNKSELMSVISDIKDASIEDGGTGAFYIFLKKN